MEQIDFTLRQSRRYLAVIGLWVLGQEGWGGLGVEAAPCQHFGNPGASIQAAALHYPRHGRLCFRRLLFSNQNASAGK